MTTGNHVTSPYSAIVDGKRTGLASCADRDACPRASTCLRADPKLKGYTTHNLRGDQCAAFITNQQKE